MNGWWWTLIVIVVWCLFCWYHNSTGGGDHRLEHTDHTPTGQVWFHDEVWWTFTRRHYGRVPREFDKRSNPLDHEEVLDYEEPIPPRIRRVYKEVEY